MPSPDASTSLGTLVLDEEWQRKEGQRDWEADKNDGP